MLYSQCYQPLLQLITMKFRIVLYLNGIRIWFLSGVERNRLMSNLKSSAGGMWTG